MTGIQSIPHRIPETWDAKWFERFIRDVLVNVDARNALGTGITVSGDPDTPASLAVDDIPLDSFQDVSSQTVLGRVSAGTGEVEQLSAASIQTVSELASTDNVTFNSVNVSPTGVKVSDTKVIGTQQGAIASLTDSTGGSADDTLASCGNTSSSDQSGVINDNFAEVNAKLDAILSAMRAHGLINT